MNDSPTVAALETSATETPVAPVPVPADAPVTGRQPGARTVAIRKLLEDTDGTATYSQAKQPLLDAGFDVDENTFNVTKSAWKRAKLKPVSAPVDASTEAAPAPRKRKVAEPVEKVKPELPEVSVADAFAYVQAQGGLEKAEADLRRRLALVKQFKTLLRQAQKLAS